MKVFVSIAFESFENFLSPFFFVKWPSETLTAARVYARCTLWHTVPPSRHRLSHSLTHNSIEPVNYEFKDGIRPNRANEVSRGEADDRILGDRDKSLMPSGR